MNKLFSLIFLLFVISSVTTAQIDDPSPGMPEGRLGGMKKIEQLEKIKLIEALDMDEETTLKFFARRNAHEDKIRDLMQKSRERLNEIDAKLKEKPANEKEINSLIEKYFEGEKEIGKEKESFIRSLSDILSVTQIAKLVVFEKKFRDEIRDILFKTRMERRKH